MNPKIVQKSRNNVLENLVRKLVPILGGLVSIFGELVASFHLRASFRNFEISFEKLGGIM